MLAFIHIPKTSGMSFKELIFESTSEADKAWYMLNFFDNDIRAEGVILSDKYSFVGGHLSYDRYAAMNLGNVRFCSILRNPLERVYSYFNHIVVRDKNHPLRSELVHSSLVESILNSKTFKDEIENGQCKYLTGKKTSEEAIDVISKNNIIVGTIENIEPFLGVVFQYLGINKAPAYLRANSAEANYASLLKSDETDRFVNELIAEDIKLYNHVKEQIVTL